MVTEQIANLSTRKCRMGSSPILSAISFIQDNLRGVPRRYVAGLARLAKPKEWLLGRGGRHA